MSETIDMCLSILESYIGENSCDGLHCWKASGGGSNPMIVLAYVGDETCEIYADAEECYRKRIAYSIMDFWADEDVTRCFTPEQIKWMANQPQADAWLRNLAQQI